MSETLSIFTSLGVTVINLADSVTRQLEAAVGDADEYRIKDAGVCGHFLKVRPSDNVALLADGLDAIKSRSPVGTYRFLKRATSYADHTVRWGNLNDILCNNHLGRHETLAQASRSYASFYHNIRSAHRHWFIEAIDWERMAKAQDANNQMWFFDTSPAQARLDGIPEDVVRMEEERRGHYTNEGNIIAFYPYIPNHPNYSL